MTTLNDDWQQEYELTLNTLHDSYDVSETPDEVLVRSAVLGSTTAFDQLAQRHRQAVLNAARVTLGDRTHAEDVAQQALLDAFRGLPRLQDATKFQAWLLTITKRCALHYKNRRSYEHVSLELTDAMGYPLTTPQASPVEDELKESIRASLAELSERSRQVMVLHYLEGYLCSEIAMKLGVPEGTIKRIMHESRNSLRSRFTGAGKRGDGMVVNGKKVKSGPRRLVWWINGQWPGQFFSSSLPQAICLSINKKAKAISEIAEEVDANPVYVEEAIQPLLGEGLIEKTANGRYLTGFIALDAEDWIEITKETRRNAAIIANMLTEHLPRLESAWNKTPKPAQGFSWSDGIWPTISILVCNRGLVRNSPPGPAQPEHRSGGRYWAGGREEVEDEYVLWGTGFSIYGQWQSFRFGFFTSFGLDRKSINTRYHSEWIELFAALNNGIRDADDLVEASGLDSGLARQLLAEAIQDNIITRSDQCLELAFPIFREEDNAVLTPVVDEIASDLSDRVIKPATANVDNKLRELGYGHLKEQFPAWRAWLEGNIAAEAVRELLKRRVLPDPGNPAPANFALIGWTDGILLVEAP